MAVSRLHPVLTDLPQSEVRENAGNLTETVLNEHQFSVLYSVYPWPLQISHGVSKQVHAFTSSQKVTLQGFCGHSPQLWTSRLLTECDKLHQHPWAKRSVAPLLWGDEYLCSEQHQCFHELCTLSAQDSSEASVQGGNVLDGTWKYGCWKYGCFPASTLVMCLPKKGYISHPQFQWKIVVSPPFLCGLVERSNQLDNPKYNYV